MKIFDFITAWVDGGKSVPLDTSLSGVREKKAASPRRRLSDRESFAKFMKLYKGCCIVICVLMVVVLLIGAVTLPVFGDPVSALLRLLLRNPVITPTKNDKLLTKLVVFL